VTTGSTNGGTTVTITGMNLSSTSAISFGGSAGTSITNISSTQVSVVTPAQTPGAKNVSITTPYGTVTSASAYTYDFPPTVTSLSPASGSTSGGTTVTITGTNLSGTTSITFGGTAGTSLNNVSATQVTVVTPAKSGAQNVVLTTQYGSVTLASGFTFATASNLTTSTITATSSSLVANGTTTTSITVQLKDASGNNLNASGGIVTLSVSGGGSIGSVTNNNNGSYSATYTSGTTSGTATISGTLAGSAFSNVARITLTAGSATQLLIFAGDAQKGRAGQSVSIKPQVKVLDVNNNPVSGVTVSFVVASGGGSVGTATAISVNGIAELSSWTLGTTAGANSLTVSVPSIPAITNVTFSATGVAGSLSAARSTLVISDSVITADGTATTSLTISIFDSNGNPVLSGGESISVSLSSAIATASVVTDNNDGTYSVTITAGITSGTTVISASTTASGNFTSTVTLTLDPDVPTKLTLTRNSVGTASGAAFTTQPRVTLQDANGNTVTGTAATITASISAGGTLVGTTTADVDTGTGVATFTNLGITGTAGTAYTITYASGSYTSATQSVTASVGAATKVSISRSSVGTASGAAFTTQPQVTIKDSGDNTVTTASSNVVASISAGGTLVGTTSVAASSGVATFTNLGITGTAGTAYTITYTVAGLTTATQSVTVSVGAASKLSISTASVGSTYGVAFSTQPQITLQDTGGNTVTGSAATITATITQVLGTGALVGTVTAAVNTSTGVATFNNLGISGTIGQAYTITYSTGALTSATASITVSAATGLTPTFGSITKTNGGFTFNVTNYSSSYTFTPSITSGSGTVSAGIASGLNLPITVTGMSAGASVTVRITTSRDGYTSVNDSISGSAKSNQTITFAALSSMTVGGSTQSIDPTTNAVGPTLSITNNSISVCTIATKTITAVSSGTCSITVTFSATADYNEATQTNTASVSAGSARTPVFGTPTRTSTGFTVVISNYSASYTWSYSATNSATVAAGTPDGSNVTVTVAGLSAGQSSSLTAITVRDGFATGTASVNGTALAAAALSIINVVPTGDGATFQISTTGATAGTPTATDVTSSGRTLTVTGPSSGIYTITGALNGDQITLSFPWTANSGYAGTSPTTKSVTVTAPPSAPNSLTVSSDGAADGTLKVTWTAPTSDGGSSITSYEYQTSIAGSSSWSPWRTASTTLTSGTYSSTITGLTNAKLYVISVRAVNALGSGTAVTSNAAGVRVPGTEAVQLGAPGTPVLTAGDTTIQVSVLMPTEPNSYNAITTVQYSLDSGASWSNATTAGSSTRTFTISALTNGTTYPVTIRIQNIWGNGLSSSSVNAKPAKAPTTPGSISWTISSNTIALSYSASVSGSASVTYEYQLVQRDEDSDSWEGASTPVVTGTSVNLTVENSKKYRLRIRSKNDAGLTSNWSATQVINTTLAGNATISGPTSKALTVGQNGFTLSVSATAGAGQSITGYQWYKKNAGTYEAISGATTNTFTKSGNVVSGDASDYVVDVTTSINGTTNTTRSSVATVTVSAAAPTVAVTTLAGATVGKSYTTTLSGTGGVGPYTWASSDLPSWMSRSGAVLSGTPVTSNAGQTFRVVVTDSNGVSSASTTVTITISAAMVISTKTLNIGGLSKAYSQQLAVEGGAATYVWSLRGDDDRLPAGLELTNAGEIRGTPTRTGSSTFYVKVTDANGATASAQFTLTVTAAVPGAPTSLTVTSVESGAVNLNWTAPTDDGGSSITYYVIEYATSGGEGHDDDDNTVTITAATARPYKLTGLTNGKTYKITVKARNASATGPASNMISDAQPAGKAAKPSGVSIVKGEGGMSLRWNRPSENGGYEVSGYEVQCQEKDRTNDSDWFSVNISGRSESGEDNQSRVTITKASAASSFTNGREYRCRIRAVTSKGSGDWSDPSAYLLLASVPDQPSFDPLTPYTFSDGKLTVKWVLNTTEKNGGSVITGYRVTTSKQKGNSGEGGDDEKEGSRSCSTSNATSVTCEISGVPTKGYFNLNLFAVNAIGSSPVKTLLISLPGKTQALTVSTPSGKKMGDPDFSIGATFNSGLRASYTSTTPLVCTITGERQLVRIVTSGTCKIEISQSGRQEDDSDSDWGAYSPVGNENKLEFTIAPSKPGSPSITSVSPGNAKLTVVWAVPTSGGPVTGYRLQYSTNGTSWEPVAFVIPSTEEISARTKELTGLVNGTAYYVRIAATNSAGSSDWVTTSSTYIPYTVPEKSTISNLETTAATGSAKISWTAPGNGGSAITGYVVTATASGKPTLTCTAGAIATNCTISSIVNKVEYTFVLKAKNKAGDGANSDARTATLSGLSQEIQVIYPSLKGWTVGDPDVQISASATSGLPVQYASTTASICTVSASGVVHFLLDGTCNVTLAQDGTGSSYDAAPSVAPVQMIISPDVPSAPTISSVTNTTDGLVVVWSAPSRLGGGTITYKVTASPGNGSPTVCEETLLTCTLGNGKVTKGILQTITVYAWNSKSTGLGTASTSKTGTWQVKPDVPEADSSGSRISKVDPADGKAVIIYWKKSLNNGGAAITSYTAKASVGGTVISTCSVSPTSDLDTNGYNCTIGGLTTGTTYTINVYAYNSIGESSPLSRGTLTPGVTPTITYAGLLTIPKNFGDNDFPISATVSSGSAPVYTRADGDAGICSIGSSNGLVHIIAVGTCHIAINAPANTGAGYLAAVKVDVTVVISAVIPAVATINSVSVRSGHIKVYWTEPTFKGGATTTSKAVATLGGSSFECTGPSPCEIDTNTSNDGNTFSVVVIVTNTAGSSTTAPVSAKPYQDPLAPIPVVAVGGNNQISLSWNVPANAPAAGEPITGYEVWRSSTESGTYTFTNTRDVDLINATSYIYNGIQNGTTIWFKIRAVTAAHQGTFSEPVSARTNVVPTAPQSVSATPSYSGGAATLVVKWSPPSSNGGTAITGYKASAGGQFCTALATETTCEIPSLSSGTSYVASVVATNGTSTGDALNIVGTSPAGVASSVQTISKPTIPSISSVTPNHIAGTMAILINGVADPANAPILSYTVVAYTGSSPSYSATTFTCSVAAGTSPLGCTIYGLAYKTNYTFITYATNIAGNSTNSAYFDGGQLQISQTITSFGPFDNQSFKNGRVSISATSSSGLAVTFTTTSTKCSISGNVVTFLGIGSCTITAAQAGDSKYNAAPSVDNQTFQITADKPDQPALTSVTPGATKVTANWSAIATTSKLGGSTLKYYVLSWATKSDFSDEVTATVGTNTREITGLVALTPYLVRVKVISDDYPDGSDWSNTLIATPFGLPLAPASASNTFNTDNPGALTAGWAAVTGDATGGIPITSYTAEAYVDNAGVYTASTHNCTTTGTSCLISGLSGALRYVIKVYATNAVGDSPMTTSADSRQPGATQSITATNVTVPHDIRSFILDAAATSGLPLIYSTGTQNPTDALSGRVVCSVNATTGVVTVDLAGTCTIILNQDGKNAGVATSYLASEAKTITVTVTPTDPTVVQNLVVNSGDTILGITWSAPVDDGGRAIDAYRITWYPTDSKPTDSVLDSNNGTSSEWHAGARTVKIDLSTLSFNATRLTNGVTYTVIVQARNKAYVDGVTGTLYGTP
jgi:hypothetical protein